MGFKFRKRINSARGLWLNVSKGLPSFLIGKRGVAMNTSKRDMRTTVGTPGRGFSYTTKTAKLSEGSSSPRVPRVDGPLPSVTEDSAKKTLKKIWPLIFAPLCGALLLLFAIFHGDDNRSQSRSIVQTGTPELATPLPAGTGEMISDKAILEPTPEVRRAEVIATPEVRRAQLVATPEVRRAELVATPTHNRTKTNDIRTGRHEDFGGTALTHSND